MTTKKRAEAIMRAIANRRDGLEILQDIQERFQEIKHAENWTQIGSVEGTVWRRMPDLGGGIIHLTGTNSHIIRAFNGENLRTVFGLDHAKCVYNWYLAGEGIYLPEQPVYDAWTLTPDMLDPNLVASHENGDVLKVLQHVAVAGEPRFYIYNKHTGYTSGLFSDVWSYFRELSTPVP